ncbi:SsrA-binding protein SmpB [Candidatus Saccharibacteria bacterium]|nr:SsrA-binding protein SmpB [Candidatus Saccharibacteria bacterium]
MNKKKQPTGVISNKRARFDFDLKEPLTAGIVLNGPETRSLRSLHGSLQGAFVQIIRGEAWLMNCLVTPLKTNAAHLPSEMQNRNRKLLLKQRELDDLIEAKQQGNTIVPLRLLTRGRFIKVEIAVGRGKKQYDKRQTIKKRDENRNTARELKNR